jgi:hypothetical protein
MAGVFGYVTKVAHGKIATPTVLDAALDPLSESLRLTEDIADMTGLRGTRSRFATRSRVVRERVGGSIVLNPNSVELANLLPLILGTAVSTITYALAEALTAFSIQVDRSTKVFTYAGCAVNSATFRVASGQPLELTLDLVGRTETVGNSGSGAGLTPTETTHPYIASDLVLTINSVAHQCSEMTITISNFIDTERYFNTLNLVTAQATDRLITLSAMLPYGDSSVLYDAGSAGYATTAVLTNTAEACALSFSMPALEIPAESPTANGRGEIMLPINGVARVASGGAALSELVTTLDSTP